jgi:hypothetical protein
MQDLQAAYEPKNGWQKSGGPMQSPGPLGEGCRDAHPHSVAPAATNTASRTILMVKLRSFMVSAGFT